MTNIVILRILSIPGWREENGICPCVVQLAVSFDYLIQWNTNSTNIKASLPPFALNNEFVFEKRAKNHLNHLIFVKIKKICEIRNLWGIRCPNKFTKFYLIIIYQIISLFNYYLFIN